MKKFIIALFAIMVGTQAFAQFEEGKNYVAGSFTGLGLSYSETNNWEFGFQGTYGRFIADSWMAVGRVEYSHSNGANKFTIGAGIRYYIIQNGLHFGMNMNYLHDFGGFNHFQLGPELGYTFFLNKYVTLEPAIYYNISTNHYNTGSQVGLRIGVGYFF